MVLGGPDKLNQTLMFKLISIMSKAIKTIRKLTGGLADSCWAMRLVNRQKKLKAMDVAREAMYKELNRLL